MVELEALANSNRIRLELLENALDIYTGTSLNKKINEASTNDERLEIIQEELIFIVQMCANFRSHNQCSRSYYCAVP